MSRTIGVPARKVNRADGRTLATSSLPFAAQDVFSALLAKVDALILAVLTTQAAVGIYGAAYRLFESTLLVPYALAGAFSAMYTYLGHDSEAHARLGLSTLDQVLARAADAADGRVPGAAPARSAN